MQTRRRSRRIRDVQRALTRVAAAVLAVVMLVGILRAGSRYVYCPAMNAVLDAPCCGGDRHRSGNEISDAVEAPAHDCCERRVLGSVPSGATSSELRLQGAPIVAVLPPFSPADHPSLGVFPRRFEHEGRAGPSPGRHRAELMVFLN